MVVVVMGGWGVVRVGAELCEIRSFWDSFCDRWGYDVPPDGALPVPPGWHVQFEDMICEEGGCAARVYVLGTPSRDGDPVQDYLAALEAAGWRTGSDPAVAYKDDSRLLIAPNHGVVATGPAYLHGPEYVYVALTACGEGAFACK